MLVTYCCSCPSRLKFSVAKSDTDIRLLSLSMSCPSPECRSNGSIEIASDSEGSKIVPAKELFLACQGRGFSEERRCSPEAVRGAVVGGEVIEMDLKESSADKNRSIINSLVVLKDGIKQKIHLSTSTKGATIYMVTHED